jgi:predicted RNA methylase
MSAYQLDTPVLSWMPELEMRDAAIGLRGYVSAPDLSGPDSYRLAADGQPLAGVETFRSPRPATIGLRGELPVGPTFAGKDEIVLRVVNAGTGKFIRDWDHFFVARPGLRPAFPLPPVELSYRIIRVRNMTTFELWGYSIKRKYEEAVRPHAKADSDKLRLLDWGCGCGRLARFFVDGYDYHGIDIDREAIAWCRQAIPQGKFEVQSLRAETGFQSGFFDIVIGNSIFTHLREADQFAWLAELQRIAKPDGIVAVSVNCATSLFNAGNKPAIASALKQRGFCDTGPEPILKGVTADDNYYRNIYHTHDYIRETWSRYFSIEKIVPGFAGNMQDLVLMRPLG